MAFYIPRPLGSQVTTFLRTFAQDDGLPFASVLTEADVERAVVAEHVSFASDATAVFTPLVTLWAFVGQVLAGSKSCVAAVARVNVLLLALGRRALFRRDGRLLQSSRQAAGRISPAPDLSGRGRTGRPSPVVVAVEESTHAPRRWC